MKIGSTAIASKRLLFAGLCIVLFLTIPFHKSDAYHDSSQAASLKELEVLSEALYRYMQDGNGEKAQLEMDRLVHVVEHLSFKGLSSVEGIHALSETIIDTREALTRSRTSFVEWKNTSSRLYLAVNSLIHKKEALWQQYDKLFTEDLNQLSVSRTNGDIKGVRSAVTNLKTHYATIRPAAMIRLSPSRMNQADSWMSFTEGLITKPSVDMELLGNVVEQGGRVFDDFFGKKASQPALLPWMSSPSPFRWIMLLGGWIVLALTYAGIRNYNAYQQVRPAVTPRYRKWF